MKTFGETIRAARRVKAFTLERVAKACHTHKGYISGIENAKVNAPSPKVVARLCRLLDLDERRMLVLGWWEKRPKGVDLETAMRVLFEMRQDEAPPAAAPAQPPQEKAAV